jgi:hypothetical protein
VRAYAPVLPLVLYALLITAGCNHELFLVPFLLAQAACFGLYAYDVRRRFRDRR